MLAVLGTGSWGCALAAVAASVSSDPVLLWGRDSKVVEEIRQRSINSKYLPDVCIPRNIETTTDIEYVLTKAEDILLAIPSNGIAEVLATVKKYISPKHRISWSTKGLAPGNFTFIHEYVVDTFGANISYAIISGPSFAIDVALGKPTAVAIAANNNEFAMELAKYFHTDNFRVYLNDDVIGVQFGGVIKNILAVACGIIDGLDLGPNAKSALITRGLAEGVRLAEKLGAKSYTLYGLSGIGDIILSCTDDKSRNRRFGLMLGAGATATEARDKIGQAVEAVYNLEHLLELSQQHNVKLPIAEQISLVLQKRITPLEAMHHLMTRPLREEFI